MAVIHEQEKSLNRTNIGAKKRSENPSLIKELESEVFEYCHVCTAEGSERIKRTVSRLGNIRPSLEKDVNKYIAILYTSTTVNLVSWYL